MRLKAAENPKQVKRFRLGIKDTRFACTIDGGGLWIFDWRGRNYTKRIVNLSVHVLKIEVDLGTISAG